MVATLISIHVVSQIHMASFMSQTSGQTWLNIMLILGHK